MTRPPRLEFAGARYHVINRGNYRSHVFGDDGAAEAFERTLAEAAIRYRWRVAAYVVMRNHFHLAVETPEPNLSEGMKWLQGTWARRVNRFRGQIGRPFQGRFKSLVVEDGEGYRRVCDYIHLNPVRARAVPMEELGGYRRSSLWRYLNGQTAAWMDGEWLLSAVGGLDDSPKGWRDYVDRLACLVDDPEARKSLSSKELSRGWCIGGREFRASLRESMKVRLDAWRANRFAGLEPEDALVARTQAWGDSLEALARAAHVDLGALPPRKSAPEKVLLASAMKLSTSVSNGWLASRLAMGEPASASQFVRRFLLTDAGKAAVEGLLSRVKE